MKSLLIKFYRSLAFRVAYSLATFSLATCALAATASVANAHDLPAHFPTAPTDWGMIQQDCLGYRETVVASDLVVKAVPNEFAFAQPDIGNPPEPQVALNDLLASDELVGPSMYDGVDCAQLESFYRDTRSYELVEQRPAALSKLASSKPASTISIGADAKYEFNESYFAACTCEFENRQANQSILPPRFALKRTFVEDYFASGFNRTPLVVRSFDFPRFDIGAGANSGEPLAVAVPKVRNKQMLADALSQFTAWDCIARSEFASSQNAFQFGELTSSLAKTWFSETLPTASQSVVDFAKNVKPAKELYTAAPKFIIFQTASGNEVAVPIAQARDWKQPAQVGPSKEFRELVDTANARLQWAGGRLSAAASYMNDWFSDRMARTKSNDIR